MAGAGALGSVGGAVKLLGSWQSGFAMRPRIALNVKGVSYEYQEENLREKSQLLIASNPVYKKIPVLIHNGKPISESLFIVQYIDDAFPSSSSDAAAAALLPSDPYRRALARFWAMYSDDKLFPSLIGIVKAATEDARAAAVEGLLESLRLLEGAFDECSSSSDAPYFNGDGIGYLDIALGSYLAWLKVAAETGGVELLDGAKFPRIADWAERFCRHTAVRDVMPETDKLAAFARVLQAKMAAAPPAAN